VLKGVLPAGAVFPFDFGFVPSTCADDGDPLDVVHTKNAIRRRLELMLRLL
jgi:inorganic pyrophosphatase